MGMHLFVALIVMHVLGLIPVDEFLTQALSEYRIARNFCGPKILRIAVKRPLADNISANYTFNC